MSHTVQVRKQGTKTLIEKTRRKVERIRANAIEANKEASAAFAKLMQQEFNRERGRISECQREFKKGLRNQLRKLGEMDDKIVALREETTKLKKGAVKKIGESNKELAVTQDAWQGICDQLLKLTCAVGKLYTSRIIFSAEFLSCLRRTSWNSGRGR